MKLSPSRVTYIISTPDKSVSRGLSSLAKLAVLGNTRGVHRRVFGMIGCSKLTFSVNT